ncbi:Beta-1,3-galactosyltransferase GALT1 [Vitis vinifera]|uniref:Beta-1,3-galactosyltransferase GALT1 n=1 Tax=Vitis vinifera TaxID=29760 RepID=A0A438G7K4_VITVI|nr:Beta-1,3-galactosyltransferase GALT1 [Vitis vinifera]
MVWWWFDCILVYVAGSEVCFHENPISDSYLTSPFSSNSTNPLEWINAGVLPVVQNPENASQVISADSIVSSLFGLRNISDEEQQSLHTWDHLKYLINHAQVLPNALEAIKEAGIAWTSLLASVEEEKTGNLVVMAISWGRTTSRGADPPIILHYNVRLHGDKITEDPVIVQNTWTIAHDWG